MVSIGPIELLIIVVAIALLAGLGVGVWVLIRRITGVEDDRGCE
jgi:hypothetical protein